jgi:hypothetical protein
LKFGILEDKGAFYAACTVGTITDDLQQMACIENALEADLFYINKQYAGGAGTPGVFWADQGEYVVGYFGACGDFSGNALKHLFLNCPSDWETIWTAVQNYVDSNSYNMKFIFQFGSFDAPGDFITPSVTKGEYAWTQPVSNFTQNTQQQWWWCDPSPITCNGSTGGYLDNFYYQGSQNPTKLTIGLLYAGFDDSNAIPWGSDRVIAQQCGQVLLNTANEVTKGNFWGTTNQIPYMLISTWNDYEEGTEVEGGVDNCLEQANLAYKSGSNSIMQWTYSIESGQNQWATVNTIHHLALWTAPHGGTTLTLRKQVAYNSTSFDLSTLGLPSGTYDVYLESVGEPLIQNEVSNKLVYTQP